jgi:hypothetical protein
MTKLLAIFLAGLGIALTCMLRISDEWHPTIAIGVLILLAAILLRWNHLIVLLKQDRLKPYWITIPYLIILASAAISHFIYWSGNSTLFLLMAIMFGLLYLLGKDLGKSVLWSLPVLAITTSITLVATLGNYYLCGISHTSAVVMIIGALVAPAKYRWLIFTLVLPGLAFSKSEEGLLALGIIVFIMLIRHDWNYKIVIPILVATVTILITITTNYASNLFPNLGTDRLSNVDIALHGRWFYYTEGIRNFIWYGSGWNYNTLCLNSPWERCCVIHNVPLLIATQLGIPAGLAWLALIILAIVKTQYKYLFAAMLGIAIIDHMWWTFLMVMPWLLIGIGTKETGKDYIFRRNAIHDKTMVRPTLVTTNPIRNSKIRSSRCKYS